MVLAIPSHDFKHEGRDLGDRYMGFCEGETGIAVAPSSDRIEFVVMAGDIRCPDQRYSLPGPTISVVMATDIHAGTLFEIRIRSGPTCSVQTGIGCRRPMLIAQVMLQSQ